MGLFLQQVLTAYLNSAQDMTHTYNALVCCMTVR